MCISVSNLSFETLLVITLYVQDHQIYYVQESIYIGGREESQKIRIIHTLTPEANNCNLLVDRYIKALVNFCD